MNLDECESPLQDVNHAFRLYITTKQANPTYSPEVCARVAIIDFMVTQRGLEDQLLSLVIANERTVGFVRVDDGGPSPMIVRNLNGSE